MFKCPRQPECTRVEAELAGHEYGPLGWVALGLLLSAGFAYIVVIMGKSCARAPNSDVHRLLVLHANRNGSSPLASQTLASASSSVSTLNEGGVLSSSSAAAATGEVDIERPLLLSSLSSSSQTAQTEQEQEPLSKQHAPRWKRKFLRRFLVGLFVFMGLLVVIFNPMPPLFSVCDVRWNVLEAYDSGVDFVDIELLVSIWNPNHFDLTLDGAQGTILLHSGSLADFAWQPTRGQARVPGGHVFDTRVVVKVEATALQEILGFLTEWAMGQNIILTLNLGAYFSLQLPFGIETPQLAIGSDGLAVNLTQVDRKLCMCNAV